MNNVLRTALLGSLLLAMACDDKPASSGDGSGGDCNDGGQGGGGHCGSGSGSGGMAAGSGGAGAGSSSVSSSGAGGGAQGCANVSASCAKQDPGSEASCQEVAGAANTATFQSDCEGDGGVWSGSGCDAALYSYGCALTFPGGCTASYIDHTDPTKLANAVMGCEAAGGTVIKP